MERPTATRSQASGTRLRSSKQRTRPGDATAAEVRQLVDAIDAAQRMLRGVADQAVSELGGGLTPTQFRLLHRLRGLGTSRLIDLAEVLSIAPSTATRICDILADRQLIVRHRRGRDRRELQIELTSAGVRLLDTIDVQTMAGWRTSLEGMPSTERRLVTTALGELTSLDDEDDGLDKGAPGITA